MHEWMIWLELLVVLGAIFVGSRVGGVGLGLVAAVGLAVLVFVFGLPPSSPPGVVIAIVVAVVSAASTLQSAGGMALLVSLADKLLRKKPEWITFVGPTVAYLFTFCSGTGHVAYAILPVIAEVSRKAGVRPERPMSISVIASQQAITASPLAAATVGLLGILTAAGVEVGGQKIQLWHILAVCIPSTFIGCMAGAAAVMFVGKDLKDDPEYQARLASGAIKESKEAAEGPKDQRRAKWSIALFLSAAALIVAMGMFQGLRPSYVEKIAPSGSVSVEKLEQMLSETKDPENSEPQLREQLGQHVAAAKEAQPQSKIVHTGMPTVIQIVMYAAAGLMMLFCGAKAADSIKTPVASAGVVAVVSIVGLGWMGNCFFDGNKEQIVGGLSDVIRAYPWIFAIGLFGLSVVLFSQASTVAALMPLGLALGLSGKNLIAMFPAVNGYFFLPTYGTIVAAVAFDTTGTTRIGKYVLNHSFMLPGLVATTVAVVSGWVIGAVLL
jgi:anaerobic C4-dicarboxylate transporter DcuA